VKRQPPAEFEREGPLTGPEGAKGAIEPAQAEALAREEWLHRLLEPVAKEQAAKLILEAEAVQAEADSAAALEEPVVP
jgi:hypothetical protein